MHHSIFYGRLGLKVNLRQDRYTVVRPLPNFQWTRPILFIFGVPYRWSLGHRNDGMLHLSASHTYCPSHTNLQGTVRFIFVSPSERGFRLPGPTRDRVTSCVSLLVFYPPRPKTFSRLTSNYFRFLWGLQRTKNPESEWLEYSEDKSYR